MVLEGFCEKLVDQVDEIRGGTPRFPESAGLFRTCDGGDDEIGVGPAESIDGLFHIAHPDDALGALCETGEESQLDGACVLELIDDEQVDFIG